MTRLDPGLNAIEDVLETCEDLRYFIAAADACLLTGVHDDALEEMASVLGSMVVAGREAVRKAYLRIATIEGAPPEVEPLLAAAVALHLAVAAEKASTDLSEAAAESFKAAAELILRGDVMTPRFAAVAEAALDAPDVAEALQEIRNDPICRGYLRDLPQAPFGTRILAAMGPEGEPPDR